MKDVNDRTRAAQYDAWLTTDPADREECSEHEQPTPCRVCRQEAAEYRGESDRELGDEPEHFFSGSEEVHSVNAAE